MELIRIKLESLIDQANDSHLLIDQYLSTYPYAQYKSSNAANGFKDKINEIVIFIAASISKSCKDTQENRHFLEQTKYSPQEIGILCKIKAKLEGIRYELVNISSNKTLHSSQIYSILQQLYMLLPNNDKNIEFKGATKGRNFQAYLPQTPVKIKQKLKQQQQRVNQTINKKEKERKPDIFIQTIKKRWNKDNNEETFSPKKRKQQANITLISQNNTKKRIFQGKQYERRIKKKRFNYIQDFQKQEQKLKQHYRILQQKYSTSPKQLVQQNLLKPLKINEQKEVDINEETNNLNHTINLEDSLELMKENQNNTTAHFITNIHKNEISYHQYSFSQSLLVDQPK